MGGDPGPLIIKEDRGLRGAALRGGLAPGRARGRQAGRVETPTPLLKTNTHEAFKHDKKRRHR
jgi:hypothetical protein